MVGRVSRKIFWIFVICNTVVAETLQIIFQRALWVTRPHGVLPGGMVVIPTHVMLVPIVAGLCYLPSVVMAAGRLNDTGRAGWPAWLVFAAKMYVLGQLACIFLLGAPFVHGAYRYFFFFSPDVAAALVMIAFGWVAWLCAQPGNEGDNRYGPPPGGQSMASPPDGPSPTLPQAEPRVALARVTTGASTTMRPASRGFGRRGV